MPNWTESRMTAVLPTRNVEKLKDMFLSWDDISNKEREGFFYRTFLNCFEHRQKNEQGMSLVCVYFSCAWSLESCLMDNHNDEDCITINRAVKELGIKRLTVKSEEPGNGFEESITYDDDNESHRESGCLWARRLMFPDPDDLDLEDDLEDESDEADHDKGEEGLE